MPSVARSSSERYEKAYLKSMKLYWILEGTEVM